MVAPPAAADTACQALPNPILLEQAMTNLSFRLPSITLDPRVARRPAARGGALRTRVAARRAADVADAELIAMLPARRHGSDAALRSDGDDDGVAGSGWFDSTWDLKHGLDIAEGLPSDLPLDGWLQVYLALQ